MKQITFAYTVLTDNDNIPGKLDIQLGKIAKLRNPDARKMHLVLIEFGNEWYYSSFPSDCTFRLHRISVRGQPRQTIPCHSTSSTSTATASFCLRDPTMMPSTGETSEKSRPTASTMWSFSTRMSLVGSKPIQPISTPHHSETHAWVASAPCRRGLPGGGMVRR